MRSSLYTTIILCKCLLLKKYPLVASVGAVNQLDVISKPERIPSGTMENAKQFSRTNGATFIDGEEVSLTDKLIQRVGPQGSSYHLLSTGKALYRRREVDTGRDVIVFPDPNFPPGDGHFVVLKRVITNYQLTQPRGPIYEGFYLVLGDGLHAYMSKWKKEEHIVLPGERIKKKKEQNDRRSMMHKTYNIEYSEVESSRMVKRFKRQKNGGFGLGNVNDTKIKYNI
ncbi:unnamed protein product [Allacma fusca]|uniref:Uncharacterized protein n=1 Tax=Allacma fusca TaxID=39272 RepID=A0A8J2PSB1_9HEXA|nr:unnamed protein product [Allacma fusca]